MITITREHIIKHAYNYAMIAAEHVINSCAEFADDHERIDAINKYDRVAITRDGTFIARRRGVESKEERDGTESDVVMIAHFKQHHIRNGNLFEAYREIRNDIEHDIKNQID